MSNRVGLLHNFSDDLTNTKVLFIVVSFGVVLKLSIPTWSEGWHFWQADKKIWKEWREDGGEGSIHTR